MNRIFPPQSDHPLFRYFTDDERTFIEAISRVISVEDGDYLIRANEDDSTLFAVEIGHLDVIINRDGQPGVLATVGPGEVLGEVSFIDDSTRSVSVKAGEKTVVRAWEKSTLVDALRSDPQLLAKFSVAMSELLVERLRDSVRRHGSFRPA
ncbi:MAG TPA: cyclic nucleotide-binding domain-containing protein [Thermoanaerobaculia bacterium]